MPIHDWTRVIAGIFHDFHHGWISTFSHALNTGRLPTGYYSLAEPASADPGPDLLTQDTVTPGLRVARTPPKVRFTAIAEMGWYAHKRNRVVIHHASNHRVVAMIEIVSPGNKSSQQALRAFVDKTVELIEAGIHLLIVDLFPPGPRDPQGIHEAIWSQIEMPGFVLPEDKPLTLAAYSAGVLKCGYIDPVAVGDELPDMPLFLEPDIYIPVPLAETYQSAWEGVPQYWRSQLESPGTD